MLDVLELHNKVNLLTMREKMVVCVNRCLYKAQPQTGLQRIKLTETIAELEYRHPQEFTNSFHPGFGSLAKC